MSSLRSPGPTAVQTPSLSLRLLGSPAIESDGRPIDVDTRKATALLAYLAVTGQAQARERLVELLWPDYDGERGRAALRRTLSVANKAVGGSTLLVNRATVELPASNASVDVAEFRALVAETVTHAHRPSGACARCIPLLSEAVALHRGDFLTGFALRDSYAFDEWQFAEAEALRRELGEALERLVRALVEERRLEEALSFAHRRLALDSLSEAAHRDLMRIHSWRGDRSAALKQYRECRAVLERELGVAPLAETTALYEAITQGPLEAPARSQDDQRKVEPKGVETVHRPPFIGREDELAALLAIYGGAAREGHIIVIEGEAGIGKTRLAEEFLAETARIGARRAEARSYEGEAHLAYAVMAQALESLVEREPQAFAGVDRGWLAEGARLSPALAAVRDDVPPPRPLHEPGARAR